MARIQIVQLLLIAGTSAVISLLPTLSDTLVAASLQEEQNRYPTVRSLGTLNAQDTQDFGLRAKSSVKPQAPAEDEESLQPIHVGEVVYVTGGIGEEERYALNTAKRNYNLQILNASKSGEFIGDTHLIVQDHRGGELLNVSAGPIVLVRLPEGRYTLVASSGSQTFTRQVHIGKTSPAALRFNWD